LTARAESHQEGRQERKSCGLQSEQAWRAQKAGRWGPGGRKRAHTHTAGGPAVTGSTRGGHSDLEAVPSAVPQSTRLRGG
jgi:hypothetical protein